MDTDHIHAPGEGRPKHSTQIISLFVGGILFIVGLSGILFSGFAGLHLSWLYSTIIAASGVILFYSGYKDNSRDAFVSCLFFTLFFGLHALAGWIFGQPAVATIGPGNVDPKWITIIPNIHELGKNDHILNTILSLVLLGGAIDWWRRHTSHREGTEVMKEVIEDDYKDPYKSRHQEKQEDRPLHH